MQAEVGKQYRDKVTGCIYVAAYVRTEDGSPYLIDILTGNRYCDRTSFGNYVKDFSEVEVNEIPWTIKPVVPESGVYRR